MEELVKAIEKMSEPNYLDYLAIVMPIALSLVAIIISISTARKQNKIALFQERYAIYQEVLECEDLAFMCILAYDYCEKSLADDLLSRLSLYIEASINEGKLKNREIFIKDVCGELVDKMTFVNEVSSYITSKESYAKKASLLFSNDYSSEICTLLNAICRMLVLSCSTNDVHHAAETLKKEHLKFNDIVLPKMEKQLKL